ncbi:major histocompatibility complex class I-related gene protein-like isoform X2 [Channa argus]|uniref:major histocompatibility complex class I-related gene protein-like isoform X2 n=1 Tax=Channa argus TaxID=215402 RepID=UPI0035210FA8
MELVFLFFFVPAAYSVKHSLTYTVTTSSGLRTFPEFVLVSTVDGLQISHFDSINQTVVFKQDWMKKLEEDEPQNMDGYTFSCVLYYYEQKDLLSDVTQHFNQTEGVHILQNFYGCEWDDETEEINGYNQFGYDGEDFVSLDPKNLRWLFSEQAATYKDKWDPDENRLSDSNRTLNDNLIDWLKKILAYEKHSLPTKVPPSVSLLQKSPSSPVSCHATGFYPDRATVFWRKDGQELHEDVDHGEILPNHDGTFQMRVDLKLSSVKPEDWRIYDCVFQLYGVKDNIITKLDKTVIRSNWENTGTRNNEGPPSVKKSVNWTKWENTGTRNNEIPAPRSRVPVVAVIGVAVGLMLLTACITGLFIWRKNNGSNTNSGPTVIDLSSI